VPVPNPAHLLEQAERLAAPTAEGEPIDADLRRAISSAYYAVFHAVLSAAADRFVGRERRSGSLYSLAYRSVNHTTLLKVCEEVGKPTPSKKYEPYFPTNGFGQEILRVATAVALLREKRDKADYEPMFVADPTDVSVILKEARTALESLEAASEEQRVMFLGMLLFQPRS
jgi:uncharacterized protein (UPF0332 family)